MALYFFEKGGDVEAVDNHQMTPLLIATFRGCTESVQYLLGRKVNMQAQDCNGRTAMHIVAQHQYISIFKLLIEVTDKIYRYFYVILRYIALEMIKITMDFIVKILTFF